MSDGFRSKPVMPTASASVPYSAGLNARTRYSVRAAANDAVLIWVASPNRAFRLIVSPRWGDWLGASRFIFGWLPSRAHLWPVTVTEADRGRGRLSGLQNLAIE